MYSLKDLCVVLVYYKGLESVITKISALACYVDCILVIENGIYPEYANIIKKIELIPNVTVLNNAQNMGIAYALNQGLQFAEQERKDLLLTLDQDSHIDIDAIQKLVSCIDLSKKIISVGPYYGNNENAETKNKYVNYLITSGNVVHVGKSNEIGGYANKLFIDCVDIEFSFRVLTQGYKMIKVGGAFLKHKIGEYEISPILRIKHLAHSPMRYFFIYRNQIFVFKTFFSKLPVISIILLLGLCIITVKLLFLERNRICKIRYAYKGLFAGIRSDFIQLPQILSEGKL